MQEETRKENIFGKFLNRIGDIIFLNLLWLFCSLPIVTMGAATTAAYYVVLHWNDGDFSNTRINYFESFKQNWKQATLCWLILLAAAFIGMEGLRLAASVSGITSDMLYACATFELILTIAFTILVFPVLANFEVTLAEAFKNSLYIMFRYLWYTLAVFATVTIGIYVVITMAPPMFCIVGGLLIYLNGRVFKRVFEMITKTIKGE